MTQPNDKEASPFAPTAIDQEVNSFIADIAKEFVPEEEVAPEPASQAKLEAPPTPGETQNSVEDPTERGLERLVAREVGLREREKDAETAKREVEALRARLSELEPRALTPELLDKIKLSPQDGLRAIGLDPDEIVRTALMEKLGDRANTPEMRDMMEKVRLRKEMEALKAQVQEAERRNAAQAYHAQVTAGAQQYVKDVDGLSKHAPTVATVAKTNPDRVFSEIMEEITRDAAFRASREPNGDIISFQEAAQRVDKRWSAMKALLGADLTAPSEVNPGKPASIEPPKTNSEAKIQPKTPPTTIKPPERPLAPWLQTSYDDEEALREAMLEWKRLESTRR